MIEPTASTIDLAKAILKTEHDFFTKDGVDNNEHIPKMKRIIKAVSKFHGGSKDVEDELHRYALDLFVESWMEPIEGEKEIPVEKDAIECFEAIYGS